MEVFVTVGMSRWPFDRLLEAIRPLCGSHRLMVQTGWSDVSLPCTTERFLPFDATLEYLRSSDVVICHAGNTVRLVQRLGKVPIAMAREAARGEMCNDHQVAYLRHEETVGRVVAAWDAGELPSLVTRHAANEARLLAERQPPTPRCADAIVEIMDRLCATWIR